MQTVDPKLIDPNPFQSRLTMDTQELRLLADDIKAHDLLQPPTVRKHPPIEGLTVTTRYQLAFGHRRHAAWMMAFPDVNMPVNVMDLDDRQMFEYAAVENNHEPLSAIEKAKHMQRYMAEFKTTQTQAGALYHLGQAAVSNLIRLLALPEPVQAHIQSGDLPERLARELVPIAKYTPDKVIKAADRIAAAKPGERENETNRSLWNVYRETGKALTSASWYWQAQDHDWPSKTTPVPDANGNQGEPTEIGPCKGCEFSLPYNSSRFCVRAACWQVKERMWQAQQKQTEDSVHHSSTGRGTPSHRTKSQIENEKKAKAKAEADKVKREANRAECLKLCAAAGVYLASTVKFQLPEALERMIYEQGWYDARDDWNAPSPDKFEKLPRSTRLPFVFTLYLMQAANVGPYSIPPALDTLREKLRAEAKAWGAALPRGNAWESAVMTALPKKGKAKK